MFKHTLLYVMIPAMVALGQSPVSPDASASVPIATQWLYDAIAPSSKGTIDSVVRIFCTKTNSVGSGFILDSGYAITNNHVVQGCTASDLEVKTSTAAVIPIANLWIDEGRDLAALKPKSPQRGIFKIEPARNVIVGTEVSAWGYPFAHAGPAPLLTVGHLSGFYDARLDKAKTAVKRLVVNGAFNPGNSGGPLISPEGTIVGVVVAKWTLPLPQGLASALKALDENKNGMQFTGTQDGKTMSWAESQLTAALLTYYGQVSQVYIGEAIAASELTAFLDEKRVPWNAPKTLSDPAKAKSGSAAKR
jgi:S1-C subfamily serine protease